MKVHGRSEFDEEPMKEEPMKEELMIQSIFGWGILYIYKKNYVLPRKCFCPYSPAEPS